MSNFRLIATCLCGKMPTVTDRLLKQAVGQVLAIKFEMIFEDYSYGFRPNRNAQQAILKVKLESGGQFHHFSQKVT